MKQSSIFVKLTVVFAAAVLILGNGTVMASSGSENAAKKAARYLKTQIRDNGGFGSPESSIISTSAAIMAFKSAGVKIPAAKSGKTPLDYLEETAPILNENDQEAVIQNAGQIAHVVMALKAAGKNPKDFAGIDWIALLRSAGTEATGSYGRSIISQELSMIALEAAGEEVSLVVINWLKDSQEENGGYASDMKGGLGADTNSTALAIQALIGAGVSKTDPSVKKAVKFLNTQQNKDGGFPFVTPSEFGTESDANSTAWVIQALVVAGEDIEGKSWVKTAITPMGFLMSLQNADGGLMYQKVVPESNLLSASQAIPALMMKPLPYKAPLSAKKAEPAAAKSNLGLYLALSAAVVFAVVLGLFVIRKTA